MSSVASDKDEHHESDEWEKFLLIPDSLLILFPSILLSTSLPAGGPRDAGESVGSVQE